MNAGNFYFLSNYEILPKCYLKFVSLVNYLFSVVPADINKISKHNINLSSYNSQLI